MVFPCVKSANTKIQIQKDTNTHIHKYFKIFKNVLKCLYLGNEKRFFRSAGHEILVSLSEACMHATALRAQACTLRRVYKLLSLINIVFYDIGEIILVEKSNSNVKGLVNGPSTQG